MIIKQMVRPLNTSSARNLGLAGISENLKPNLADFMAAYRELAKINWLDL
jgi:hypothetical protein